MVQTIIFYLFSTVLLASAVMVVTSRNPVHAVLFLILCFFNAAGLFVLMGAEFIAFILIIVYVGAVAVLFLFVVMMLDINFQDLRRGLKRYLLVGVAIGLVLLAQLALIANAWIVSPDTLGVHPITNAAGVDNTRAIGRLLYTVYFYPFQVSGLILLVAMIGAIVLTQRDRRDARRQNVSQQLNRSIGDTLDIRKVSPGQGIDL
jgi:NADH-quinone oxidoreductase subunit J